MTRRTCLLLALTLLAGCGGASTTSFSDRNRPLAETMVNALKKKDKMQLENIYKKAKERREQDNMTSSEFGAIEYVYNASQNQDDYTSLISYLEACCKKGR